LLCLSIRLDPSFSGPWTRLPAISFLVFLFVYVRTYVCTYIHTYVYSKRTIRPPPPV
jgi:hypothetical protein